MDRRHSERLFALLALMVLGAGRALAPWVGSTERIAASIPLRCPVHYFLGLNCPTCGLGRAVVAAWLGRYAESWQFHPLGIGLFALFLLGALAFLISPQQARRLTAGAFRRQ